MTDITCQLADYLDTAIISKPYKIDLQIWD